MIGDGLVAAVFMTVLGVALAVGGVLEYKAAKRRKRRSPSVAKTLPAGVAK